MPEATWKELQNSQRIQQYLWPLEKAGELQWRTCMKGKIEYKQKRLERLLGQPPKPDEYKEKMLAKFLREEMEGEELDRMRDLADECISKVRKDNVNVFLQKEKEIQEEEEERSRILGGTVDEAIRKKNEPEDQALGESLRKRIRQLGDDLGGIQPLEMTRGVVDKAGRAFQQMPAAMWRNFAAFMASRRGAPTTPKRVFIRR
ncbi:MAG: hypothetical protein M1823_005984 [Watsoniomyces obsoletus]|nr:MAG: hypothetical protein M1823_005984 [Watsoniomyces obsoletus]